MTGVTSVPQIEFAPQGLVLPLESDILAGVQADMNAAFGGNLNPALNTPQGQFASSQTGIIAAANDLIAFFINQVNPDRASGFMQDALARIYFLTRTPGAPTAVQALCIGTPGVPIPTGATAQDTSGNRYICTSGGVIGLDGTVTLSFANILNGPIPCPANTLTKIYQAVAGWDSINNPTDGIPGANVESQAAFALRRQVSVALNSHGPVQAIYGAVFNVPGVIDAYAFENVQPVIQPIGATNYPVAANSIYVAAIGGAAVDIANAIFNKKAPGCNYNGNTAIAVPDKSGYSVPYPTYQVLFNIPTALPIFFFVQISANAALPDNITVLVQAAIVASFLGADGSVRARIGALLLASKFYAPVALIDPSVAVLSILLGPITPTLTSFLLGIDQAPTIDPNNIAVALV